jgi:hypothetical protein
MRAPWQDSFPKELVVPVDVSEGNFHLLCIGLSIAGLRNLFDVLPVSFKA